MGDDDNLRFSDRQYETLHVIVLLESTIAILMNLFVVFTYLRFSDLRKRSFEMVLVLSVTSILSNATYYLAPEQDLNQGQCVFQGFVMNLFGMGMIFWTTCIAYCLYCAVVLQTKSPTMLKMQVMTWSVSLLLALLPLFTNSYEQVGAWCWISSDNDAGLALRWFCWYIPLWGAFIVNLYLHNRVSNTLRNFAALTKLSVESSPTSSTISSTTSSSETNNTKRIAAPEKLKRMADHLSWYPLIFVISWLPNTISRLAQAIDPALDTSFSFTLFHVVCHGVFYQSVGNVLAYGLNDAVKAKWSILFAMMKERRTLMPLFHFDSSQEVENDMEESRDEEEETSPSKDLL